MGSLWKARTINVIISISLEMYPFLRFSSYLVQFSRKCFCYHLEKSNCKDLKKKEFYYQKSYFRKRSLFYNIKKRDKSLDIAW